MGAILAESIGGKGLNRARQNGAFVSDELLARTQTNAQRNFAMSARPLTAVTELSAPIAGAASGLGGGRRRRDTSRSASGGGSLGGGRPVSSFTPGAANIAVRAGLGEHLPRRKRELKKKVASASDESERNVARRELASIDDAKRVDQEVPGRTVGRLDDARFVAGFGSNGGEEFLSYMNISESLVVKGGLDWKPGMTR